jgi:hypothetical protein
MSSAWEHFNSAVLELVRATPIKQRLIGAHRKHLSSIKEDQLPRELRTQFARVMRLMDGVKPMPGEDRVSASVRKLSPQQADECAEIIVELFSQLSQVEAAAERSVTTAGAVLHLYPIDGEADVDYVIPAAIARN